MTRTEKTAAIAALQDTFSNNQFFYFTDASSMTVEQINALRRLCFDKGVKMKVIKNTLARKALESFPEELGYDGLYDALKGPTTIMYAEQASMPAKILADFRKQSDAERPVLKAAYIEKDIFLGDDQLDTLKSLKSKEDLIGEVLILLESPIKQVLGALNSGGTTLSGLLKSLEERGEN